MRTSKKNITALYPVSRVTKKTQRNLWVAFPEGNPARGLVYSSILTRNSVRTAAAKVLGVSSADVRTRRVENLKARKIRNSK